MSQVIVDSRRVDSCAGKPSGNELLPGPALTEKDAPAAFTAAVEAGKDAYSAEKRRNESKAIAEGRPSYPVDDKKENN